jgi:Tol biopolymer transport system component
LYDFEREVWRRLTTEANNMAAVWSPDGQQIVFSSNRDGAVNLYLKPADGSRSPEALTRGKETWFFARSWSSDGRRISMYEQRRTVVNLSVFDLGDRAIHRVASRFKVEIPAFSPDGRWIAFNSDESGGYEIYVSPAGDLARKRSISDGKGVLPRWRRDGRELFYKTEKGVMGVDISGDAEIQIGKPHQVVMGDYVDDFDVAPDGRRFVMIRQKNPPAPAKINVIVGAFDSPQLRRAAN